MRSAAAAAAERSPAVAPPANNASILRSFSRSSVSAVMTIRPSSFRLDVRGLEDRRPAHELVLEHARCFLRADVAHRLEAEPQQLLLERVVGQRLLGDLVD